MSQSVVAELAPHGVLRAAHQHEQLPAGHRQSRRRAIRTVSRPTWRARSPTGWACRSSTCRIAKPGELADAVGSDAWDIGLIGAEPARAEKISFTAAYVEIEATYLVPAGSPLKTIAEVDRPACASR